MDFGRGFAEDIVNNDWIQSLKERGIYQLFCYSFVSKCVNILTIRVGACFSPFTSLHAFISCFLLCLATLCSVKTKHTGILQS